MSRLTDKLIRAQKNKYDEYYTRIEHVEHIFTHNFDVKYLKNKIIYCPCDQEWSAFVQYFKNHKEEIGYKELIYTWDDFNNHEDLFEKCDIVITNPPFSVLIKQFIPMLCKYKCNFFIFGAKCAMNHYHYKFKKYDVNIRIIQPKIKLPYDKLFITPDETHNEPAICYLTNLDHIIDQTDDLQLNTEDRYECYCDVSTNTGLDYGKVKLYNKVKDIPKNINENFLAPITILWDHNRRTIKYKNTGDNIILRRPDDKPMFTRIFCLMH